MAFNPVDGLLASGSEDKTVRLWHTGDGNEHRVLQGHSAPVWSVAFSIDGKLLASADDAGNIKVWDVAQHAEQTSFKTPGRVYSVAFTPDGKRLAAGGFASFAVPIGRTKLRRAVFQNGADADGSVFAGERALPRFASLRA